MNEDEDPFRCHADGWLGARIVVGLCVAWAVVFIVIGGAIRWVAR